MSTNESTPDPTTGDRGGCGCAECRNGDDQWCCESCHLLAPQTSTPRPTEADVEALAEALCEAAHPRLRLESVVNDRAAVSCPDCMVQAEALLASDRLAARDAEHEREVAALRAEVERMADVEEAHGTAILDRADALDRAEAAEADRDEARRELADLRAKVAALAAKWKHPGLLDDPDENAHDDLRDLLPTEDDQ